MIALLLNCKVRQIVVKTLGRIKHTKANVLLELLLLSRNKFKWINCKTGCGTSARKVSDNVFGPKN